MVLSKEQKKQWAIGITIFLLGVGISLYKKHLKPHPPTITQNQTLSINPIPTPNIPIKNKILIHIAGEVITPGLYEFTPPIRAINAIQKAGGLTPLANIDKVNLAKPLKDGTRLYIPTLKEKKTSTKKRKPSTTLRETTQIPINTATTTQLTQIPGIGPKTAQRILSYRQENGPFTTLSQLTEVKGIGEKTLQKIKTYINL